MIHTIDDILVNIPYRRIPDNQLSEVKQHLQDLLNKGIIRHSTSRYGASPVLVRKKTGELGLCIDYRKLNSKTIRDVYPIPRIEESLDVMSGARYFTALYSKSAYNQIEMDDRDRHKTACQYLLDTTSITVCHLDLQMRLQPSKGS